MGGLEVAFFVSVVLLVIAAERINCRLDVSLHMIWCHAANCFSVFVEKTLYDFNGLVVHPIESFMYHGYDAVL